MLFIENMNLMKLVFAIFTLYQNAFYYFFQASEEGKSGDDNEFKMSWATCCSRTILDSAKQTKWSFWIRIFSHSLNFFHFYLIYFYTHGISLMENSPHPGILTHLPTDQHISPY